MANSIHEGHRKRVIDDFLRHGFDMNTPSHKILELLLFYCVPRKDTNELAHQLIEKYGSLSAVLDAPINDLSKFKGLSVRAATLLKLIIPISNIYNIEKADKVNRFDTLGEVGKFLFERMRHFQTEKFGVLIMGADGKFKDFEILSNGEVDSVNVSIRELLKTCLDKEGVIIAIAHNHPSGVAIPSSNDVALTERISEALSHTGLRLIEHIIAVNDDYVSMAESAEYSHIFKN